MPYKRSGSPNYYVEIRPEGYGRTIGPRSTGVTSKRKARQIESTLRELAASGRHDVLDAVVDGEVSPADVHGAKAAGRLDALLNGHKDPPLASAVEQFLTDHHDEARLSYALDKLLTVAPNGARLSWIRDPDNLRKLLRYYDDEGYAPTTEHREISGVRQLVRQHYGETAQRELFSRVTLRPQPDKRIRYLEPDEIKRVRKEAGPWWRIFALYLATGMRHGELVNLQVRDVNVQRGLVTVEAGKSDQAARDIPLDGEALELVRNWIDSQNLDSSDPLFPGVGYRKIGNVWREIRERVGVEDATIHSLRHTYAVHCARSGMPMIELKHRLGHANLKTTERYARYRPRERSGYYTKALDRMGVSGENPVTDSNTDKADPS